MSQGTQPQIVGNPSLLTSPEPHGKGSAVDGVICKEHSYGQLAGKEGEARMGASSGAVAQVQPPATPAWLWGAILVAFSAWDLLVSLVLACVSLAYAYRDDGVSLYCLSMQALSHLCSSFVLVLRFMGDLLPPREDASTVTDDDLLHERRRRDLRREQGFAISMAIAMMISCAALLFKAFRKLKFWDLWFLDHTEQDMEIEKVTDLLAWCGFGGYVVQLGLRVLVARRLRKSIIWHASAVSAVSLIFFCVLAVAASYEHEWSWKAEPIAAMVLILVMICESIRIAITFLGDVDTQLKFNPDA
mmetsp:Transcript_14453/g.36534  ORF Transcript_14453/g.36534 Transcript_14453/m.36534 type:complete len:302 (-) Transcript_14453:442-1347(-)|eukprot:CAMPEP_0115267550 /NCGR_PEP_ID=MMETSP0270-20121206/52052_1 /TAXON_ID=71861 /ORGANISM="Scrippsiella trochoidea, Strain CCMP3099" /LENGTH=301 /DNA_ID=CAMNT_0002683703 /DNA_START=71 /DNA_END=976 /DNA_ORIENTATION=-